MPAAAHCAEQQFAAVCNEPFQDGHGPDVLSDGRVGVLDHRAVEVENDIIGSKRHRLQLDVFAPGEQIQECLCILGAGDGGELQPGHNGIDELAREFVQIQIETNN